MTPVAHSTLHTSTCTLINSLTENVDIKAAIREQDYRSFVLLHPKESRFNAFLKIKNHLGSIDYWKLLTEVWIAHDNRWRNIEKWEKLLKANIPDRHFMMDPDEQKMFDALPARVKCYRGYIPGKNGYGLSFTLDVEVAAWYARQYNGEGKVMTVILNKSDIFAYINIRNEQELLYCRPR